MRRGLGGAGGPCRLARALAAVGLVVGLVAASGAGRAQTGATPPAVPAVGASVPAPTPKPHWVITTTKPKPPAPKPAAPAAPSSECVRLQGLFITGQLPDADRPRLQQACRR